MEFYTNLLYGQPPVNHKAWKSGTIFRHPAQETKREIKKTSGVTPGI